MIKDARSEWFGRTFPPVRRKLPLRHLTHWQDQQGALLLWRGTKPNIIISHDRNVSASKYPVLNKFKSSFSTATFSPYRGVFNGAFPLMWAMLNVLQIQKYIWRGTKPNTLCIWRSEHPLYTNCVQRMLRPLDVTIPDVKYWSFNHPLYVFHLYYGEIPSSSSFNI